MKALQTSITCYGISDTGLRRPHNEDHFMVADLTRKAFAVERNTLLSQFLCQQVGRSGTLLAVADGVGGYAGGELASQIAVEATAQALWTAMAVDTPSQRSLYQAIEEGHRTIQQSHERTIQYPNMSSTLTVIHVTANGVLLVGQIGDSRAYLFRHGKLTALTEDQTMVSHLQKTGQLSEQEVATHPYRHIILQALGQDYAIQPDVRSYPFHHQDRLLLCTDGLSSYVSHVRIEAVLAQEVDEQAICRALIHEAHAKGGPDNVTVLVASLHVLPGQDRPHQEEPTRAQG
jgi:protein phosphatase